MTAYDARGGGKRLDTEFNEKNSKKSINDQIIKALKDTKKDSNSIQPKTGRGAQFVYAAATVANILCDNLTEEQINLLANFLAVVTTCAYAILRVENPEIITPEQIIEE